MSKRTADSSTLKRAAVRKSNQSDPNVDTGSADNVRRAMIAEAAYYRAERRGFSPGFELEDWLESENELNTRIQARSLERVAASSERH
jgi:hypothetical protein